MAIAYLEITKEGIKDLTKRYNIFLRQLKEDYTKGNSPLYIADSEFSGSCSGMNLFISGQTEVLLNSYGLQINNNYVSGKICARTKQEESILGKLIRSPKYDAQSAYKDSIGMLITVPNQDVPVSVLTILNYIKQSEWIGVNENSKISVEFIRTCPQEAQGVCANIINNICKNLNLEIKFSNDNPSSSSSFKIAKIVLQNIDLIDLDEGGNKYPNQSIEIQIEPEINKNNDGLSHHSIYELIRDLAIMTRLFGAAHPVWFKKRIEFAIEQMHEGRLDRVGKKRRLDNIIEELAKDERWAVLKVQRTSKDDTKSRIVFTELFERLSSSDLFDFSNLGYELITDAERKKALLQKK